MLFILNCSLTDRQANFVAYSFVAGSTLVHKYSCITKEMANNSEL